MEKRLFRNLKDPKRFKELAVDVKTAKASGWEPVELEKPKTKKK